MYSTSALDANEVRLRTLVSFDMDDDNLAPKLQSVVCCPVLQHISATKCSCAWVNCFPFIVRVSALHVDMLCRYTKCIPYIVRISSQCGCVY
ncbi:hypothetical protein BC941DRAFT_71251 [Chlamydoabsidia padenii]|nr:hypothetical protein BC941DRAFT_71251 [Chlamydoabsidia padenii]